MATNHFTTAPPPSQSFPHDGTTVTNLLELLFPSLPDVEDIREIVLKSQYASGCVLRCACHREDCPICGATIREAVRQ
jgi:hypothetical protein